MKNNTDYVATIMPKYNFLTPIRREIFDEKRRTWKWLFRCDCGNEKIIDLSQVKSGKTKSCGCFKAKNLKQGRGPEHNNWKGKTILSATYIGSIKRRAKLKGLEYNLTDEFLYELYKKQYEKCKYSGLQLSVIYDNFTASLDRIDSSMGYIESNVQWLHKDVNYIKYNLNEEEFLKICKLIYEKSNK